MKKIIVLLVVLILIPCSSLAEADKYAAIHEMFANHSNDDLLTLQKMLEIELEYRGLSSGKQAAEGKEVIVPVGEYAIGEDIPANTYTIKLGGSLMSMVSIYDKNGNIDSMYTISPSAPIGKCALSDGQSIKIIGEPVVFIEYEGLGF